jgi:hypothetical protein
VKSLKKCLDLVDQYDIKHFFVAHSYTLNKEDMMLDARSKVLEMISVREKKDQELEE